MTSLDPAGAVGLIAVGFLAGGINTIVGSGSLLTFPTLLALGYPALTANVSNTIGLVPGSLSGALGYRRELVGQRRRLVRLAPFAAVGGLLGGVLLLVLPAGVFRHVVPVLVLLAVLLVAVQPWLARRLAARASSRPPRRRHGDPGRFGCAGVGLIAVYGGYFGAAIGVLLIGVLGLALEESLQRVNAAKNVVAVLVNSIASVLFAVAAPVAWWPVLLLALSSFAGGQVGALVGRRLRPDLLRLGVVVIGLGVGIKLLVSS